MPHRTNTRGRAIGFKRRQLTGQAVDMAMALFDYGANLEHPPSCRLALVRAGYPMRTVDTMLNAVLLLASQVDVEKLDHPVGSEKSTLEDTP